MKKIWWGKRLALGLALLVVIGVGGVIVGHSVTATGGNGPVISTENGKLRGKTIGNAHAFLGVPFAAAPINELRWKPPETVSSWHGVREAKQFKSPCAALSLPSQIGIPSKNGSTNEDCLYLNVYTPKNVHKNTPVMVFIHGGGFQNGAGSDHEADVMAARGDVVVVTINYRMGPFGFLALPSLSAEDSRGTSGNLGLQDQQAALKWVKRNIARFGGDKNNIAAFGISAGGRSICAHITSPSSAGLFNRAIIESSPCNRELKTLAMAENEGSAIATQGGCSDATTQIACLRSKSTSEILAAGGNVIGTWSPNIDGVVVPQKFADAISSGNFNKMPVIQGTTHDEYLWHVTLGFDGVGSPVTEAQYPTLIQSLFGAAKQPQILAQYPVGNYPTPSKALARVVTDARYSCPARATNKLFAPHVPTYAYEFNDANAPDYLWAGLRGPVHAAETLYLFRPQNAVSSGFFTPAQGKLSDQIINYWRTFAKTGTPNGRHSPFWPTYTGSSDKFQSLLPGSTGPIANFAVDHKCDFWDTL